MSQPADRDAAHCPGWPLRPQRCSASRCAGRACGAPLTPETSASPAGLTARARPKARPAMRAANLSELMLSYSLHMAEDEALQPISYAVALAAATELKAKIAATKM